MPSGAKNTKFTNRHADEARAREEQQKAEANAKKQKQKEDAMWEDDDKLTNRKLERQKEKEEKEAEAALRRAEARAELEAEERSLEKKPPKAVTKKQLQKQMLELTMGYDRDRGKKRSDDEPEPLVDGNPNRQPSRYEPEEISASGLKGAVDAMEGILTKPKIEDRHIGKRARAAYRVFEKANMPALKEEKPGLRRTQYNDLMWERWQKSAENPFVQRAVQRADEGLQRKWCQADEEPDSDEEAPEE